MTKADGKDSISFKKLIESVSEWATLVFRPLELFTYVIRDKPGSDAIKVMTRFWWLPIFFTVLVDGATLHTFGIELNSEPVFSLAYTTISILKPFCEAILLYYVLRLMKIDITLELVFICYTMTVIYAPIFSWLKIPSLIQNYSLLVHLKSQHLDATGTFQYFTAHSKEIMKSISLPFPSVAPYLSSFSSVISLLASTLVAECISQSGEISRPKAYAATAVATAANVIPFAIFVSTQLLLVYAYLKAPPGIVSP